MKIIDLLRARKRGVACEEPEDFIKENVDYSILNSNNENRYWQSMRCPEFILLKK